MLLFLYSLEDLKRPDVLLAVSLLIFLFLLVIIISIVWKIKLKKEPGNAKELEFAAERKQTTAEELQHAQYLPKENVNTFIEPSSYFPNENTIPMNTNLDLNLQVEALEKEAIELKESLFRIKGAIGKDDEYRELKEKWYEKERQLRELRNADKSSSFVTNGFIHHEKENNTETAVHLSTEYYETSDESQEHNDAETLTMYNAPISEQPNTISEKEKETKKLQDRIAELEELPKILSEKNNLLLQELETLKAAHDQLKEQYDNLQSAHNKIAEQATANNYAAPTTETLHTPAETTIEIKNLQDKISELESLTPVLTEKNLLIEFLQNQLDKQVKNNFQLEKEHTQLKAQMLQANDAVQQGQILADRLQEDLQKKEQYNILITSQYEKALQVSEKYKQQLDETIEKLSSLQAHLRSTMQSPFDIENN